MKKISLGLLFSIGGIATGYTALILSAAIWHFAPPGPGVTIAIVLSLLYWSVLQFSFYAIVLDKENGVVLLSRKLWGIIEIGKRIPIEDIEYYYVRTANMSQTVRHAIGHAQPTEIKDIGGLTGVVEIKLKGRRKYDFIATGNMELMKSVGDEIFKAVGIKHHKVVPPKPKNRRR